MNDRRSVKKDYVNVIYGLADNFLVIKKIICLKVLILLKERINGVPLSRVSRKGVGRREGKGNSSAGGTSLPLSCCSKAISFSEDRQPERLPQGFVRRSSVDHRW